MNKKVVTFLIILLAIALIIFLFNMKCERELTPIEQVRETVAKIEESVEARDRMEFISYVSENYRDDALRNRRDVLQLASIYFFQYDSISVIIKDLQINIEGETADVYASAILVGSQQPKNIKNIVPQHFDMYGFQVKMVLEGDNWRVVSAKWGSGLAPE